MSNDTTDPTTTATTEAPAPEAPKAGDAASEESLLKQLQSDIERFRDHALRTQADFDNFRKRAAREKEDAMKFANASFLEKLFPILDNFELGLNAARTSDENSPILQGMDMVAKQLNEFLVNVGVEPVAGEGAKFDPNFHESVAQEESATVPEGVVIRQLRRGYKLRERLLRPAMVVISKGAAGQER